MVLQLSELVLVMCKLADRAHVRHGVVDRVLRNFAVVGALRPVAAARTEVDDLPLLQPLEVLDDGRLGPTLKGSIGEGSNHSNFSDQSLVKILGIQRSLVKILPE